MAGNRVEELEETVRELEATISGLTDELVETKDRLRRVESHVGADELDGIVEGKPSRAAARESGVNGASPQAGQPSQPAQQETQGAQPRDGQPQEAVDEAVAEAEQAGGEAAADGGKSDEAEAEEESSEQSDDIIVA